MLLSLNQINKSFSGKPVLKNISMTIEEKVCYGLIGANGAGKSTLLNILTGELEHDGGEVYRSNGLTLGYLKQNSGLDRTSTILEEMRKVFADVLRTEQELRSLEKEMAAIMDQNSGEYRRITQEYAQKQAYFDSRDGYQIDVKIKTVLNGMGFMDRELQTPISTLSGGEKTRLAIARLLLEEPQLLILDEPTNHLDFKTLGWLENYLLAYNGSVLVVSHDRYFLDKLVSQVFELERGRLYTYKGNYSSYRVQKEERRQRQEKEYEAQQLEIARLQSYIDKNLARASTANSAKSRIKTLENMELVEKPEGELKQIRLRFDITREPYKDVLTTENLEIAVGEEQKVLCRGIDLSVKRGEKIAVIGENGIGKSSFLKTILGLIPHAHGSYTWGKNVSISYYEQENLNLNPERLAIDELWDRFPHIPEAQIRKVLGSVLLTRDDVFKPVKVISGGERAKLAFCILMLEKSNVMLLDEPTNHLDLSSKEILERALSEYPGTLLFVSHDRYLLNKIPDKILEMTANGMQVYEGKYDDYVMRKQMQEAAKVEENSAVSHPKTPAGGYRTKEQRRQEVQRKTRIRELEELITWLEKEIALLQEEMTQEEVYTDYRLAEEKTIEIEKKHAQLDECYEEWETLQEENG
ncbi:ABC-F family ATP-binding cassette domain-containing protein [Ructibacterium gallinarum]|uniref:ABC-F family ATP-binding cassette domain-containing protein n=1 Tax=Ructibacterium gallinarum TaxID=2779355 RepID=A0A9D5M4K7_9FIRM|nr:ABC-F family ATP-binding cassette domain-containing protein [Ructibacterium gallinarum]MBE5040604.1 ABC-F family ATP-binding cassette domain-containing protein [Ructibacterium gallinarum]